MTQPEIDPNAPQNRWIRGSTVKHLIDGSGFAKTPQAHQILLTRFDYNYAEPPHTYPYSQYLEIAEHVRATLYSHLNPEEAYEQLGYLAIQDYFEGIVGQIVKATSSLVGPERGIKNFLIKIRDTLRWGSHTYDKVTPNCVLYHIKYVPGPPALMRGVIRASLEISGAKLVRLNSVVLGEEDVIHEVEWK